MPWLLIAHAPFPTASTAVFGAEPPRFGRLWTLPSLSQKTACGAVSKPGRTVFAQVPDAHYVAIAPDGSLFVTIGDRSDSPPWDVAQRLHCGYAECDVLVWRDAFIKLKSSWDSLASDVCATDTEI